MPCTLALLNDVGGGEILLVAIVGLLLFGKEMPAMARKLGRQYANFKRSLSEASTEIQREMNAAADSVEEEKRAVPATVKSLEEMAKLDEKKAEGTPVPPAALAPVPPPQKPPLAG